MAFVAVFRLLLEALYVQVAKPKVAVLLHKSACTCRGRPSGSDNNKVKNRSGHDVVKEHEKDDNTRNSSNDTV